MFDLATGNFLNKENETNGIEIFAKRDGYDYLKRIVKIDRGAKSYLNVSFFVGPFENFELCKKYGKQLFYAIAKYYFWIGCPLEIDTDLTEQRVSSKLSHFITKHENRCEINSLQILEVKNNIEDYLKANYEFELIALQDGIFPIENFEVNELEFNDLCADVFYYINVSQNMTYNLSIPILCSAIECMANYKIKEENKSKEELKAISFLINELEKNENIDKQTKTNVLNYLSNGMKMGSKRKCIKLIKQYAKKTYHFKSDEKNYLPVDIFNYCYSFRSKNTHGVKNKQANILYLQLLRYVVLDVLENILREEQKNAKRYFEPKRLQI